MAAVVSNSVLENTYRSRDAWKRLCKCVGQHFLHHMNVMMPPLLQSSQLKLDVTITSADSNIDESNDKSVETIPLGNTNFGIKTSILEDKATTCNMQFFYVDELKEGFYPWIDHVNYGATL